MCLDSESAMSRDYRKLRVFALADDLVTKIYSATNNFPVAERYGLCSQLRRSAVSTATNIVEGSARRSEREYVNFLNVAAGSSAEAKYLLDVTARLGLLQPTMLEPLIRDYDSLSGALHRLIQSFRPEACSRKPEAGSPH